MKRTLAGLLIIVFTFSTATTVFASDWDKAGKILTGIEALRIFTGGEVDVVGKMIGSDRSEKHAHHKRNKQYDRHRKQRPRQKTVYSCYHEVWVPQYRWEREYIPKHEEYDRDKGTIIVEGHYIRYKVESGGYYKTKYVCD